MNEAEVRKVVNGEISKVLERLYDALYYAHWQQSGNEFEFLREAIEEIAKETNNG